MYNETEIILSCADCGQEFAFSVEEQEFYREKGFSTPKRCNNCRANRRSQKGVQSSQRYEVICSECGCQTTVPFRPREDRPVYCAECYKRQKQY